MGDYAGPWRVATEADRLRGATFVRDSSHAGAVAAAVSPLDGEWCWRAFLAKPASTGHHFSRLAREGRAPTEAEARVAADGAVADLGWLNQDGD